MKKIILLNLISICLLLNFSLLKAQEVQDLLTYIKSLNEFRAERYNKNIPSFTDEEYQKALSGKGIVKTLDIDKEGGKGGVVLKVMDIPVWKFWATIVDRAHYKLFIKEMKETAILKAENGFTMSYHYLDIPAPLVKPRQQVLISHTNSSIFEKSGGKMLEYYWKNEPNPTEIIKKGIADKLIQGVSEKTSSEAINIKKNEGSWLLIPLPNGKTLVEGYGVTDPAGNIPKAFIGAGALEDTINVMEKWGKEKLEEHLKNHDKILAPSGEFIEPSNLINVLGKSN